MSQYSKDKWLRKTQAGFASGKWQRNFTSPEATTNYMNGVAQAAGVSAAQVQNSSGGKGFVAAQANAAESAQKAQAKINSTTAEKWANNYRRAFSS